MEERDKFSKLRALATATKSFGTASGTAFESPAEIRAELERARNEFRLAHFELSKESAEGLIRRLERLQRSASNQETPPGAEMLGSALTVMGLALDSLGSKDEARENFRRAVDFFSTSPILGQASGEHDSDFGVALGMLGEYDKASEVLSRAFQSRTPTPEAMLHYGLCLARQKSYEEAAPVLATAEEQNPGRTDITLALADVLDHLKRADEAAANYLDGALKLANAGKLEEALIPLDRCLQLEPHLARALFVRGEVARLLGDFDTARQFLERAIAAQPGDASTLASLAATLFELGQYDESFKKAEECLSIAPSEALAQAVKGFGLVNKGQYDKALEALDFALESSPDGAFLHSFRGEALRMLERIDEAIAAAQRALTLAPGQFLALRVLGACLRRQGKHEEAVKVLQEAVDAGTGDPWVEVWLAGSLRALERNAEALAPLNRLFAAKLRDPSILYLAAEELDMLDDSHRALDLLSSVDFANAPAPFWELRAWLLQRCDRLADAHEAYEQAIVLDPSSATAHQKQGYLFYLENKLEDALREINRALELDPNFALALGIKALILKERPQQEQALEALEKAFSLEPERQWLREELVKLLLEQAKLLFDQQQWDEAEKIFLRAAALAPHDSSIQEQLGELYLRKRDYDLAIHALDEAIRIDPKSAMAQGTKGQVLLAQGKAEDAWKYLETARKLNPQAAWISAFLGEAYRLCRRYDEAKEAFETARHSDPEATWIVELWGQFQAVIGDFEECAKILEKPAQQDDCEPWVLGILGWALENIGVSRAEDSGAAYQRAIVKDPEDPWMEKGLGNALRMMNRKNEARERYEIALKKARRAAEEQQGASLGNLLALMGWCHYGLGQYDEALRLYSSAIAGRSQDEPFPTQFDLALCLLCSARHDLALEEYKRVIKNMQEHSHPLPQRAWIQVAYFDLLEAAEDTEVQNASMDHPIVRAALEQLRLAGERARLPLRPAP